MNIFQSKQYSVVRLSNLLIRAILFKCQILVFNKNMVIKLYRIAVRVMDFRDSYNTY